MAQLISIYNHPNFRRRDLNKEKVDEMMEIWHNEDDINKANGVEIFDMDLFEQRLEAQ